MKLMLFLLFMVSTAFAAYPTMNQLRNATVKIVNSDMNSGGSGSILSSNNKESIALTNSHVCEVVEQGGYVVRNDKRYKVTAYKKFSGHDLCLVKVRENLGVNTPIAKVMPKVNDVSFVSGHPRLLPDIITKGHFTDEMIIDVLVGFEECEENNFECNFFGGKPIIVTYNSQLISNLIQPGNSGSGVYNKNGEIAGVVFAGGGDLSFAFIVPHMYVVYFLMTENQIPWVVPGKKQDKTAFLINGAKRKCKITVEFPNKKVENICKILTQDLLVR